ncbi:hypothetical protein AB434_0739 [Heyndrickxia coagulans]|uniref:Uncharacterized protein n=1 Tax=Heyndrickxia coagulans TaxID=1398 RepID=A0A0C5C3P0_HEYCO|nr:hypothetical protein BCO26_2651 [Heyndrickxia coagulans 2-6]AJO21219.1 hypothetical protein SB48_HM08orf00656 [Heyndrickxia coagulans]AKN53144.1 hypothetical protein AB434_0739 [Heyndrickxia coagulans]KWZ85411.1 hypothetical protein HMPREF3213_00438 [Heyndrickxia coagulans]KYC64367.1 hypothetical protein B4100_1778 [Heyndrickxia coagulans]
MKVQAKKLFIGTGKYNRPARKRRAFPPLKPENLSCMLMQKKRCRQKEK